MVKKIQKTGSSSNDTSAPSGSPMAGAIKDSAQQIWLAGLGAFAKAQEEGSKAFESLVKEGLSMQRKTQAAAEERFTEATSRVTSMATDISSKAAGQWDKLESIFEARVSKALNKLGVPSAREVESLIERIDALHAQVQRLGGKPAARKTTARPAAAPAKKAPARKASRARKTA